MVFEQELIYMGQEARTSKKGNPYINLTFANPDGTVFSAMWSGQGVVPPFLTQLDRVIVKFKLTTGRYMNLQVLDIIK